MRPEDYDWLINQPRRREWAAYGLFLRKLAHRIHEPLGRTLAGRLRIGRELAQNVLYNLLDIRMWKQWGIPALGGGDQYVMFNDRPEVRQVMEFLTTWKSAEPWAKAGGALFPHKDQNLEAYPDALAKAQAELLLNAKVFRFDASDLMPAEVGAGSFWAGMVDLVNGKPVDDVLNDIEASWPK